MKEERRVSVSYFDGIIRDYLVKLKETMEHEYIEAVESNLSSQDKVLDILGRINEMQAHLSMVEIQLATL